MRKLSITIKDITYQAVEAPAHCYQCAFNQDLLPKGLTHADTCAKVDCVDKIFKRHYSGPELAELIDKRDRYLKARDTRLSTWILDSHPLVSNPKSISPLTDQAMAKLWNPVINKPVPSDANLSFRIGKDNKIESYLVEPCIEPIPLPAVVAIVGAINSSTLNYSGPSKWGTSDKALDSFQVFNDYPL